MLPLLLLACAPEKPDAGDARADTGEADTATLDDTSPGDTSPTDTGDTADTAPHDTAETGDTADTGPSSVVVPVTGARIACELSSERCSFQGAGAYAADAGEELAFQEYDTLHVARAPDAGDVVLADLVVGAVPLEATTEWSSAPAVRLADLDGDGWDDVVERSLDYVEIGTDEFATFGFTLRFHPGPLADGPASAWSVSLGPVGSSAHVESFFVGDVDADGVSEAIFATSTLPAYAGDEAAWRIAPDGAAEPLYGPTSQTMGSLGELADAGDLDGDGLTDLARLRQDRSNTLVIHRGPLSGLPDAADADATVDILDHDTVHALGDVDGDGLADLGLGGNATVSALWLLSGMPGDGALADVARAQLLPEGDVSFWDEMGGGDVGADGSWNLVVGDPFWDDPAGDANLGAVYVFEAAPTGVVDLAEADLRVYGEVPYAMLGFARVLADGRVLAVAEGEATAGGEGIAYLLEI